jgi:hypothetical protein
MRCERCGRDISNAELWQIAADPKAPATWSMRVLCWDCREHPPTQAQAPALAQMSDGRSTPPTQDVPGPAAPEAEPHDGELAREVVMRATPPPA